jgi:Gram-negative bacterial TonB protein C-terminal
LRIVQAILLTVILSLTLSSADLAQLPYTRRVFQVTTQYLEKADNSVPALPETHKGTVLVVFWTSERGAVVSARALDGPPDLQRAAIDAIGKWKFRTATVNSQPIQMGSAVLVDYSHTPPSIQVPKPMTGAQLSPGFQFKCFDGMVHQEPASVEVCQQQLDAVSHDSYSTPLDRFTAHDQYGLVLLKYSHDAKRATEQFSRAIELAPERLSSSDAEWAYVYWHRASAEQQLGDSADAERDFSVAENSLHAAEKAIGNEKIAGYYHDLLGGAVKQHVALLESENKHDEAKQVLANFEQ